MVDLDNSKQIPNFFNRDTKNRQFTYFRPDLMQKLQRSIEMELINVISVTGDMGSGMTTTIFELMNRASYDTFFVYFPFKKIAKDPNQLLIKMKRILLDAIEIHPLFSGLESTYIKSNIKLFFSYSRSDVKSIEKIYEQLSDVGFKPWMDIRNIIPGQIWEEAIDLAIEESISFYFLFQKILQRSVVKLERN